MTTIRHQLKLFLFWVVVLFITSIFTSICFGETSSTIISEPAIEWKQIFGTGESTTQVIQTSDGGYAFMILDWSHQIAVRSCTLYKINASGGLQWEKSLNKFDGGSFVQTSDGGFMLVGGWFTSYGTIHTIVKTDSDGDIKWVKNFTQRELSSTFVHSSDGGFTSLVRGQKNEGGQYQSWTSLIKTNFYGKMQWNKTYINPTMHSSLSFLIQTSDGGYALLGSSSFNGTTETPNRYYWLVKTDSNGDWEWSRTYGDGPENLNTNRTLNWGFDQGFNRGVFGDNEAASFVQTNDGGYVIVGVSYPENYGVTVMIKTDSFGNILWNQTFSGPGTPPFKPKYVLSSVIETSDGGFALAGSKPVFLNNGFTMGWLIKTDGNGTIQWEKTFRGDDPDKVRFTPANVIETNDGSLVMLAHASTDAAWMGRFYLIKTEPFLPLPTLTPLPSQPSVQLTLLEYSTSSLVVFAITVAASTVALVVLVYLAKQ